MVVIAGSWLEVDLLHWWVGGCAHVEHFNRSRSTVDRNCTSVAVMMSIQDFYLVGRCCEDLTRSGCLDDPVGTNSLLSVWRSQVDDTINFHICFYLLARSLLLDGTLGFGLSAYNFNRGCYHSRFIWTNCAAEPNHLDNEEDNDNKKNDQRNDVITLVAVKVDQNWDEQGDPHSIIENGIAKVLLQDKVMHDNGEDHTESIQSQSHGAGILITHIALIMRNDTGMKTCFQEEPSCEGNHAILNQQPMNEDISELAYLLQLRCIQEEYIDKCSQGNSHEDCSTC